MKIFNPLNRKQRSVASAAVVLLLAGLLLPYQSVLDWLDGSTYGTAKDAAALPEFGDVAASLQPKGPLYYRLIKDNVARHLVVSGRSDLKSVEQFAAAHGFEFFDQHEAELSLKNKLREYRGREARIAIEFGDEDALVFGSYPFGVVELHFRKSDTVFTLSIAKEFMGK